MSTGFYNKLFLFFTINDYPIEHNFWMILLALTFCVSHEMTQLKEKLDKFTRLPDM